MDFNFNTIEDKKEAHNPANKQEAFCFQMLEDLKILRGFALFGRKEEYNRQADILEMHLKQSRIE